MPHALSNVVRAGSRPSLCSITTSKVVPLLAVSDRTGCIGVGNDHVHGSAQRTKLIWRKGQRQLGTGSKWRRSGKSEQGQSYHSWGECQSEQCSGATLL